VSCGVLLASAILTGALLVGDSVDYSLRETALARLGGIEHAIDLPNRFVAQELADAMQSRVPAEVNPMLHLRGMAMVQRLSDGATTQINQVDVLGVNSTFWHFSPDITLDLAEYEVAVNEKLAAALGVAPGDEISLRVVRPDVMSRDAPLSSRESEPVTRALLTVKQVLPDTGLGRHSLTAGQIAPYNAFVSLAWLQEQVGLEGSVNKLLAGDGVKPEALEGALRQSWELEHLGMRLREHPSGVIQLESDRIFLDDEVARAALSMPGAQGALAYLVNAVSKGDKATPYSFALAGGTFEGLGEDDTVINRWLAGQLDAQEGDQLRVTYYQLLPSNEFAEAERTLTVAGIVEMDSLRVERDLMPVFPGLSNVNRCADWKVGMPMDEALLKDPANEAYWQEFGQTPKLFVGLEVGQGMWSNRFGSLTAVRFDSASDRVADIRSALKQDVDPAKMGIGFLPVRDQALQAASQAMDFGQLFLGMSFFLIVAALILTGLLFVFTMQQRAPEFGTLLALGFRPGQIRLLVLAEAGAVALLASVLGALAGTAYTRALIFGLSRFWQGAVAHAAIRYHAEPGTALMGGASGFACAVITMAVASWRQTRRTGRELLAADFTLDKRVAGQRRTSCMRPLVLPLCGFALAIIIVAAIVAAKPSDIVGPFLGVGSLLLLSGLGSFRAVLMVQASRQSTERPTVTSIAIQNVARRRGRSLSVAGLLACGCFMVFAVGSMREDLTAHSDERWSGTGGFELYAEATVPLQEDPTASLVDEGVTAVPVRVRDGDDASCLNLNRAQAPRVLGVNADAMSALHAFLRRKKREDLWALLNLELDENVVPALVGDSDTAVWGLGNKKTGVDNGDLLLYRDESGNEVSVKLVGKLPMRLSVFQGTILISEEAFTRLYPSESGFRIFLIDTPAGRAEEAANTLKQEYERHGLDAVPAVQRLREFYVVQSTYLAMFLVLGGLGLTLGGAGMGIVVLRNVLERRREIAVLNALGFERRTVLKMLFTEHGLLLVAGLAVGAIAAAVSMTPAVLSAESDVSVPFQLALLLLVLLCGGVCMAIALFTALEKDPLPALRHE
jgi:ABC-type antimicrobial peptide transport system permease subunit